MPVAPTNLRQVVEGRARVHRRSGDVARAGVELEGGAANLQKSGQLIDGADLYRGAAQSYEDAGLFGRAGHAWTEAANIYDRPTLRLREMAAYCYHRAMACFRRTGHYDRAVESKILSRTRSLQHSANRFGWRQRRWWTHVVTETVIGRITHFGTSVSRVGLWVAGAATALWLVAVVLDMGEPVVCPATGACASWLTTGQGRWDFSADRLAKLAYFLVVTMTTLGFGDVVPSSNAGHLLAMVAVLLGYIGLALLAAVLLNRISRE